jgi:MFS family permease
MASDRTLRWRASFWILGLLLVVVLFAATAPSPLYGLYQEMLQFSPLTLTAIYASYAFGGVAALLVAGRLSDYLGRRPILASALILNVASMLMFVVATDVVALFAGRVLGGIGTGIASGVISAWVIDLQPSRNPRLASLVNGTAPLLGLGLGGFISGVLVHYGPDPLHLVFWLLAGTYGIAVLAIIAMPDLVQRRPGWVSSLRPAIGVPAAAQAVFIASAPALVGMWALAGLYFSLGPSLAIAILGIENRLAGGLVILALAGSAALASIVVRGADPGNVLTRGCAVLIAGVAMSLVGVWLSSLVWLYGGTVVAGLGLGPAFTAFVRIVTPLAPAERRAALLGAIYVTTYLSFSVPAIVGGAATTLYGLRTTTFGYGLAVMLLAAATTLAVTRRLSVPEAQSSAD